MFPLLFSCGGDTYFSADDETIKKIDKQPKVDGDVFCVKKKEGDESICVEYRQKIFQVTQSLDFLFVLDVSRSMEENLHRLGRAFRSMVSQLEFINWRMIFTTADHGDHRVDRNLATKERHFRQANWEDYEGEEPHFGKFMDLELSGKRLSKKWLSRDLPEYEAIFLDTLTRNEKESCDLAPYCQGDMEQPLRSLKASLERLYKNAKEQKGPVLRKGAGFVAFIVTDEDERVEDPDSATSAKEVYNQFKQLFPNKEFYSVALLIKDDDCLHREQAYSPNVRYGEKIAELASFTGGENISICERNYVSSFEGLSHLLKTYVQSFSLADKKDQLILPQKVQVEFLGGQKPVGWKIFDNRLIFGQNLQEGAKIKVSYLIRLKKSS